MLKEMGIQSKVEIEPDQQTLLADATCTLPGVISAGVPGAGGYDALFAIVYVFDVLILLYLLKFIIFIYISFIIIIVYLSKLVTMLKSYGLHGIESRL